MNAFADSGFLLVAGTPDGTEHGRVRHMSASEHV